MFSGYYGLKWFKVRVDGRKWAVLLKVTGLLVF